MLSALSANDSDSFIKKLDLTKAKELSTDELQEFLKTMRSKDLKLEENLEIVKKTSGFDLVNYLLKNERKAQGSGVKWDGDLSGVTDLAFKERILKAQNSFLAFQKEYKNMDLIYKIRVEALNYLYKNKGAEIKDKKTFYSFLQAKELALFEEQENRNNEFYSDNYYRSDFFLMKRIFKAKHDLGLQSEIQKRKFTANEILSLMSESKDYVTPQNIDLLTRVINRKADDNTWEDLLLAIKLWKDFDTYERYLFESRSFHYDLVELMSLSIQIILNKDYSEKKQELEEIFGAKLYQAIFVEKRELSRLAELSFDDENALLGAKEY